MKKVEDKKDRRQRNIHGLQTHAFDGGEFLCYSAPVLGLQLLSLLIVFPPSSRVELDNSLLSQSLLVSFFELFGVQTRQSAVCACRLLLEAVLSCLSLMIGVEVQDWEKTNTHILAITSTFLDLLSVRYLSLGDSTEFVEQ